MLYNIAMKSLVSRRAAYYMPVVLAYRDCKEDEADSILADFRQRGIMAAKYPTGHFLPSLEDLRTMAREQKMR